MTAILIGILSAVIVTAPQFLVQRFSVDLSLSVIAIGLAAALVQRMYFARVPSSARAYDGMADLFIHIHSRYALDSPIRWFYRGCVSLLLLLTGGIVGPEGVAAEWAQCFAVGVRSRNERWSEQKRRTDVACAIAAAIAAAFQAPFAAIVFCFEVGTGGRALSAIQSSVVAYASVLLFSRKLNLEMDWLPFFQSQMQGDFAGSYAWLWIVLTAVVGGLASWLMIRFFRYYQEGLVDLFQSQIWLRSLAGACVIALLLKVFPVGHSDPWVEVTGIIEISRDAVSKANYLLSEVLLLATVLASFGTVGIFMPLFTIGAILGSFALSGVVGVFVGVAAIWGGVLGAPIAASLLALEMTGNWKLMLACMGAGYLAKSTRETLRQSALVHKNLEARGLSLLDGRSKEVLSCIRVADAMTLDYEWVYEHDLVRELTDKFLNSKHPFLPVVNRGGKYVGLLTLDLIQEGLERLTEKEAFFEVKDLLYRSRARAKTVGVADTLDRSAGIFGDLPCSAVLDDDRKVVGLLFAYSVRAAYDREVARRALSQNRNGERRPGA